MADIFIDSNLWVYAFIETPRNEEKIKLEDLAKVMNDKPVLIDVRGMFDGEEAKEKGFYYRTL